MGNLKERDHLKKIVTEENIILKLIFKRGGARSRFILLWIPWLAVLHIAKLGISSQAEELSDSGIVTLSQWPSGTPNGH